MLTVKSGRGTRSGCGIGESRCFTVARVALVSFSAWTLDLGLRVAAPDAVSAAVRVQPE